MNNDAVIAFEGASVFLSSSSQASSSRRLSRLLRRQNSSKNSRRPSAASPAPPPSADRDVRLTRFKNSNSFRCACFLLLRALLLLRWTRQPPWLASLLRHGILFWPMRRPCLALRRAGQERKWAMVAPHPLARPRQGGEGGERGQSSVRAERGAGGARVHGCGRQGLTRGKWGRGSPGGADPSRGCHRRRNFHRGRPR